MGRLGWKFGRRGGCSYPVVGIGLISGLEDEQRKAPRARPKLLAGLKPGLFSRPDFGLDADVSKRGVVVWIYCDSGDALDITISFEACPG